jgi:hemolysin activation/secretion protein
MGLLRMAARTAVVAGTATAVSGRVANRQATKFNEQQQAQQAQQPQYVQQAAPTPAPVAAPAPAPAEDEAMVQLRNLAELHKQGILTDAEFSASKAKILGI